MASKKIPYLPEKEYPFLDQKRQLKLVIRIRKQIAKFDLKPEQLGFITNWLLILKSDVSQDNKI